MIFSMRSAFLKDVLWQRLRRNRMALAGGSIVLFMFLMAALASLVSADPSAIDT